MKLVAIAAAAALTAGGVAWANSAQTSAAPASAGQATGGQKHAHGGARWLLRGRLTYAEAHAVTRAGRALTLRIDRGVIRSASAGSLVLHELDGRDVTIPLSASTRVFRMGKPASVGDLRAGDVAAAIRVEGLAARVVRSPGHPPRAGARAGQH